MSEKYLTYQTLADKMGISKQSVYRSVKAGKLRAVRLSAQIVRIPSSELERLLTESEPLSNAKKDTEKVGT